MRTYLVIAALFVVTVCYAIAVMAHIALFRDTEVFYRYARSWSRMLLRMAGIKLSVEGVEHLVPATRYVYASNHASLFDIPVMIVGIPDNIRIMYKRELVKIPIFGWALSMSPYLAVDRAKSREAASVVEATVNTMRKGSSVLVFPEGTRSEDGTMGAFKRGAVSLAVKSATPIVPVTLVGTAAVLPARSRKLVGGSVRVIIHPPEDVGSVESSLQEKALVERLRATIADRL